MPVVGPPSEEDSRAATGDREGAAEEVEGDSSSLGMLEDMAEAEGMEDSSASEEALDIALATALPDTAADDTGAGEEPARAPMPQAMSLPSGWTVSSGSVVEPSAEAMVNRVVHVGSAPLLVN